MDPRRETSIDVRKFILRLFKKGISYRGIAKIVAKRKVLKDIKIDPKLSAVKLAAETSRIMGRSVSAETVRNVIRHAGYSSRVARKKPFISLQNQKKRLEFTKTHQLKTDNFWKKVIFSDESKFNIFGSDGRRTVWRKSNTVLDPKNLRPTVKHGGGSVMSAMLGMTKVEFLHSAEWHHGDWSIDEIWETWLWLFIWAKKLLEIWLGPCCCLQAEEFLGVPLTPPKKGDAFPTPGRRQCTHKYIMVWDVFWEFPAFWNLVGTVKYEAGGVLVWGCKSAPELGYLIYFDGIVNDVSSV
ncbi:transposable element Tc1 transposase [Trichonephila clavipes]|nr:transposable element Tc1 transposase [Trichonephila clavipes]